MGAEDSAREWRKGETEEWPTEHTEYTELGTRGGNRGNGRGRSFLSRKTRRASGGGLRSCPRIARRDANGGEGIRKIGPRATRNTRKGGRDPEASPAHHAKGREWGKEDAVEPR